MLYTVNATDKAPLLNCRWDNWNAAETAELTNVLPESSEHHPVTRVRLLHDEDTIYGIYEKQDQFVKATHVGYQAPVCNDSCVEFFFKPSVGTGYFNLEMNAGGSYLFYYVRDHHRTPTGFADYTAVDEKQGQLLAVRTSLPRIIDPEVREPLTWYAQFAIPTAALEPYCGKIDALDGQTWTCNFYTCGDETSHPHWITWAPLPQCNYHLPHAFQTLKFL